MLPEILINHNPILLFAQGLAQLAVPNDIIEVFVAVMRLIPFPFFGM